MIIYYKISLKDCLVEEWKVVNYVNLILYFMSTFLFLH